MIIYCIHSHSMIVWQERNVRIFEDKGRLKGMLWDLLHFYSSLWASCIVAFRGVTLSIIQPNWLAVCDSKVWDSRRLSLYIVLYREVSSYFDQNLCFEGQTSHPSLVPLLILIFFVFDKIYIYIYIILPW